MDEKGENKQDLIGQLIREGPEKQGDETLLAVLLTNGTRSKNALAAARKAMPTGRVADLEFAVLEEEKSRGGTTLAKVAAFVALAERYHQQRATTGDAPVKTAEQIAAFFAFAAEDRVERFYLLMLDSGGRVVAWRKVIEGDQTKIYFSPRLVIEQALAFKAHKVAFVHNHPDGSAKPSSNDHHAMQALYNICNSVGVNVLDSVIVARNGYYSFSGRELKPWPDKPKQ